jgi:hypothetical protein
MRRLPLAVLWIASLVAAGGVGALLTSRRGAPAPTPPRGEATSSPEAPRLRGSPAGAEDASAAGAVASPALGSSNTHSGSSRSLGALAEGVEGQRSALLERLQHLVLEEDALAILRTIDEAEDEDARWLYEPEDLESRATRLLWTGYLLEHRDEVVDLLEKLFERAARQPETFPTGEDGVTLGGAAAFDEFLAALPHLVAPERLARFRELADRIREREDDLPELVRDWDVDRYLAAWARMAEPEIAVARLQRGNWSPDEAYGLLVAAGEAGRRKIDLLPVRLRLLRVRHWEAFRRILLLEPLEAREIGAIDAALLDALPPSPQALAWYLQQTDRGAWPAPQPFLEHALDARPRSRSTLLRVLPALLRPPPPAYVQSLLFDMKADPHTAEYLRRAFGLE